LRFGEDLPVADVARILGRSPAAVKQLQRRALAELRSLLAEGDDDACG
jgi:DNA-directed RNA polymerase specialized sigma24 family protein